MAICFLLNTFFYFRLSLPHNFAAQRELPTYTELSRGQDTRRVTLQSLVRKIRYAPGYLGRRLIAGSMHFNLKIPRTIIPQIIFPQTQRLNTSVEESARKH